LGEFLGVWAWGLFFCVGGRNGGRDERTGCQRGGCMVVPGAVVSPGHTRRLRRLSCRAPHNSPCTLMPYLAQTDGAYSDAPGPDHAAVPLAVCPFCFLGSVRCGGLPGGGEPSALRWMAAGAEAFCHVCDGAPYLS